MAAAGVSSNLAAQISAQIVTTKSILPSQSWLLSFLSSQRPNNIPFQSLCQTALFRLLASEITVSIQSTPDSTFPQNVHDIEITLRRLKGPIPCQVVDVEDISRSKQTQLEVIESAERGEKMKGKEVIRIVPGEDGFDGAAEAGDSEESKSFGPHKLLLEDANGIRAFGFETSPVEGINMNMKIGAKLVLKEVKLSRGMFMLDGASTTVVGGKVDELHTKWREVRKQALKDKLENTKQD